MKKFTAWVLALGSLASLHAGSDSDAKIRLLKAGVQAPDFELEDPRSGIRFKLSAQRGKAVVLTLGGASVSWCKPCQTLGKKLQANLAFDRAKGLVVVDLISNEMLSNEGEPAKVLAKSATKLGIEYPMLADPDLKVLEAYGFPGSFPCLFVISRKGLILFSKVGFDADAKAENREIGSAIKKALEEKP